MNPDRRRPPALRRWRDETAIAALLALLAGALAFGGWTWRLDRLVYDSGLSLWRRPAPADIVIVAIDDASIARIGRWPWPRAVHATLLERLAQAHPRAIALDLVLSEPDPDPRQDRLLARALRDAAPVVLPVAWQRLPGAPLSALLPVKPLAGAVSLGTAEAPVDEDGVLRHAFLAAGPPQAIYPHLAATLLQLGGGAIAPGLAVEDAAEHSGGARRDGRFLIRYLGPPGTFERISYVDLLLGRVAPARLAGSYVLIGMTAQGLGDTLATPVNGSHEAMPGIEVLANTLATLRDGDAPRPLTPAAVAAIAVALLAAQLLAFGRGGPRLALPLAVASVPLALGASLLALRAGVWCAPGPYVLASALAYPLWSWRRLERAVAGLDREIARLAAEPLETRLVARPGASDGGDAIGARLQTLHRAGLLVRQARRFLADTLAAMPTAMLVADERMRVVLANPAAAALFEVASADELLGLETLRLLAEFATDPACDWAHAVAALGPEQPGIAVEARLGEVEPGDYVIRVAAVDLQGQRRVLIAIVDIAPVKQAEREREEALAFVSHDLRSPANSIVLLADMNLSGAVHTPVADLLREMRALAARTLALSEAFVRAAHVQYQPLQRSAVAPAAIVDDAVDELRAQALAGGVELRKAIAPRPAEVVVDRLLLLRAVTNLVGNAIRHSPRGAAVEIGTESAGAGWRLTVRDHGRGLSAAQLEQLLGGNTGALVRDARGVGLGLLFVQRVAHRHGGRLTVTAAAGGGSRF
ncbi:MAG: CHASE2 domain-containing protein, partial [Burkholderiales bacterium]|nr:CHASE2 domain-containing protein [Burkholderiales bacterium]